MKILIAYVFNEVAKEQFERMLTIQNLLPEEYSKVDKLIVTDLNTTTNTNFQTIRLDIGGSKFSLNKGYNASLQYAQDNNYDWWIAGDADRILLRVPTEFPPTKHTAIPLYHMDRYEDPIVLVNRWKTNNLRLDPNAGTSMFLTGKSIIPKVRFCEDFKLTGWDDIDFDQNVCMKQGIYHSSTNGVALHLFHERRPWCDSTIFHENKALYESRK